MKIINWRRHLPLMKKNYYEVDGIEAMFITFRPVGKTHINLKLTSRQYEYHVDEMPIILLNWKPVLHDGKQSYDHIAAEQALITKAEVIESQPMDIIVPGTAQSPAIDFNQNLQDIMEDAYKKNLQAIMESTAFSNKKLEEVILNLKGPKGKEYVHQAKQVINAVNAASKLRDSSIEFFKAGISLVKERNKQNPDAKTGNDSQKG